MVDVTNDQFEELAAEALDDLPEWVRERMENVEVVIEEEPPPDQPGLLGLYRGIPLTNRGWHYAGVLPDTITLYRANIQRHSRDQEDLRQRIRRIVAHEVAHHFGISDDRLRELDRY